MLPISKLLMAFAQNASAKAFAAARGRGELRQSYPYRSYPDCIIATRGYDSREGQVACALLPIDS